MLDRVDFFIVGVQKGGTTALASFIAQHPDIDFCRVKEAHHFDDETVNWVAPDHGRLHIFFDPMRRNVLRGEATPIYTYWPPSLERLKAYNPNARLIVSLRHPAFRAFSHWRMEVSRKADIFTFPEAISSQGRRRVAEAPNGVHRVFSYIERGYYAPQIERLLALFPAHQVHFLTCESLWNNSSATLSAIEDFLGLPRFFRPGSEPQYIVPLQGKAGLMVDDQSLALMQRLYAADIARTAQLTGLDLSHWLSPDYGEPMQAG